VSRRSATLELAVLGLLHEAPMHGYELRKRLNAVLGVFRPLSYGTLYPCLRGLLRHGWIRELSPGVAARRGRIVYELTPEGKDRPG
jgi:DNA-binding PadR family transcriptional regulator